MFENSILQRIKRTVILPGLITLAVLSSINAIPKTLLSIGIIWVAAVLSVEAFEKYLRYKSLYLGEIYDGISSYVVAQTVIIAASYTMEVTIEYKIAIATIILLYPIVKRRIIQLKYKVGQVLDVKQILFIAWLYMIRYYIAVNIVLPSLISLVVAAVLTAISCVGASGYKPHLPFHNTVHSSQGNTEPSIPSPADEYAYFYGCTSQKEIKARYKKLAQLYHPDSETGDKKSFQRMKTEYEKISKEIKNDTL